MAVHSHLVTDHKPTNGISHRRGAPYHPATNREAERFVQTFKNALHKCKRDEGTLVQKLAQFLFVFRTTPHATTGIAPAELFMKRQLRTCLDLLRLSVRDYVKANQSKLQRYCDQKPQTRLLEVGQLVLVRNFREGLKWLQGRVVSKDGPVSYQVEVGGQVWKRHIDQLLVCHGQDRRESNPFASRSSQLSWWKSQDCLLRGLLDQHRQMPSLY